MALANILENPGASPQPKAPKNILFLLKWVENKVFNFIFCCFLPARAKNIFHLLVKARKQRSEKYFLLSNAENKKNKNPDDCFLPKTGCQEKEFNYLVVNIDMLLLN